MRISCVCGELSNPNPNPEPNLNPNPAFEGGDESIWAADESGEISVIDASDPERVPGRDNHELLPAPLLDTHIVHLASKGATVWAGLSDGSLIEYCAKVRLRIRSLQGHDSSVVSMVLVPNSFFHSCMLNLES